MANGMNARSSRRRRMIGWIAAAIAVAYVFLAQLPLATGWKLAFIDSEQVSSVAAHAGQSPERAWEVKGRHFLAREDLQGVSEIDRSGKQLWTSEFPSLVTAIDISAKLSAWGLLDGSIHLINGDGKVNSVIKPASTGVASRFACIYGLALSPDGTKLAALFGLEPQHFVVFDRKGDGYSLLYDMKLIRPVRSGQPFTFSSDGKSIAGLTGDGLIFYDVKRGRAATLQNSVLSGDSEAELIPVGGEGFAFLAASGNERYAGLLRQGRVEALFPVEAGSTGIAVDGQNLTIQGQEKLSRYKVESR